MARAAIDVMQSVIFSAVLDAIAALKTASNGLPNQLIRDLQAIHPNTTFEDLPKELQQAIGQSVRSAFTQLLKEGYAVAPKGEQTMTRPLDRVPERERRQPGDRPPGDRRPPRGPRPGGSGRPGGGGGRPGGGRPGGGRPGGGGGGGSKPRP
ncbi:hypothetical protein [Sphingomonas ginkgonis]|uniref:hypothetical protein n=1 Tax=Sphingomonas ginkgonis TaxID=2315330 RepID=UPI0016398448|nr:hypothetical protein [Sphingomonas ginkgonis]